MGCRKRLSFRMWFEALLNGRGVFGYENSAPVIPYRVSIGRDISIFIDEEAYTTAEYECCSYTKSERHSVSTKGIRFIHLQGRFPLWQTI